MKINIKRPGLLHKKLGINVNDAIPAKLISKKLAGDPSPALKKELVFAKNARSFGK